MLGAGTRLGPYEIIDRLGTGGMGEVYRARDDRLDREVAIKVLPEALSGDASARERLLREARAAAALNHPHVLTVHDVGESDGRIYLAMELVPGTPLSDVLERAPLPVADALRLSRQIARALAHAHGRGIVHRDVKPSNVIVTPAGDAKVLDFGIARRLPSELDGTRAPNLTATGDLIGTPAVMAPELWIGRPADPRSDVWALGALVYTLLAGRPPYRGATSYELASAISNAEPDRLPGRVPPALRAVVRRCLERDPDRRYPSAAEVAADLDRIAPGAMPATPAHARLGRAAALVTVAVIVLAAATWAILRQRSGLAVGGGGAAGRIGSLAVLPLENFSHDPDQQYFADGMTDELITTLAQIGAVRVISRTSVMRFRGSTRPLRDIARDLGADAIVEGSVQRSGERVRITAQLIRASTDEHLWAQTYERDLRDVLALQDEVAGAIARSVQARLTPRERQQIGTARAVSPQAYELYLRGIDAYRHWTKPGDRSAQRLLDEAIHTDPGYAPAWAALAIVYLDEPGQFGTHEQDVAHARQLIGRALALDPKLGLAHEALGEIAFRQDWNWSAAEREFRQAIALSPNSFEAHHMYAHVLMTLGRVRECYAQSVIALRLDPLNADAVLHMGWFDLYVGRYPQAIAQFEAALQLDPNLAEADRFLASTNVLLGRYDDAIAFQNQAFALTGASDTTSRVIPMRSRLALNALIAARRGQADRALAMSSAMRADIERGTQTAYDQALVFAQLGRKDEAFRWLDRSFRDGEEYVAEMREDPYLAPLRSDPRFPAILRRLGLPA